MVVRALASVLSNDVAWGVRGAVGTGSGRLVVAME
jgi:hypothetical protein